MYTYIYMYVYIYIYIYIYICLSINCISVAGHLNDCWHQTRNSDTKHRNFARLESQKLPDRGGRHTAVNLRKRKKSSTSRQLKKSPASVFSARCSCSSDPGGKVSLSG